MKVVIDIDRALAEGRLTEEEYRRIQALASGQTSDLALNILIGFGVVAIAGAFLALVPSVPTVAATGTVLAVLGLTLVLGTPERWGVLGEILLVVGMALLAGGIVELDEGSPRSALAAAVLFATGAVLAGNGLLAALTVLALSAAIGARTGYMHAMYMVGVEQPITTVLAFSALAVVLVGASKYLPERFSRLTIIAARTSALLVNLGFWIGSLWGDKTGRIEISRDLFSIAWALALVGAAVWAWRENRRWPLVTATVFAAIHFYTQWFERLGANPGPILAAGLVTVATGFALKTVIASMPARAA